MPIKIDNDIFIKRSNIIHNNKYDYSKIKYVNAKEKLDIICPLHGIFKQTSHEHLSGYGCKKCGSIRVGLILKHDNEYFIKKSSLVHKNKYDYSKTNYINNKVKVIIICKKHGEFLQSPKHHLAGHGCIKCGNNFSRGEEKIEKWLIEHNIKYVPQYRFENCKGPRYKLPFDFYLPHFNMCIEFDGKHHSVPIFGEKAFLKNKRSEIIKNNYCLENNIKLLRINYLNEKNIKKIMDAIMSSDESKKNIYSHLFVSK